MPKELPLDPGTEKPNVPVRLHFVQQHGALAVQQIRAKHIRQIWIALFGSLHEVQLVVVWRLN
jgi:hypothetical protein